jgi:hypothetical protein
MVFCQTCPVPTDLPTSTQLINVNELPAVVRQAVIGYAERHGAAAPVAGARLIATTTSPPFPRRGRFGKAPAEIVDYVILSADDLLVITTAGEVVVTGWLLGSAEVRRITQEIGGVVITGLQVTAFRRGGAERESIVVRLGSDLAGTDFESALLAALAR